MCDFFEPERDHRDDGQFYVVLVTVGVFWLVVVTIYLTITRTGLGPYLIDLITEALR